MRTTTRLRQMLRDGTQLVAPGIYDALSAKAVVTLGFNGVYLGGFATSARLGTMEPLMSMTEQVDQARRVAHVVGDVPLVVDGHTAYGDAVHVTRAVREFEAAGVAAIHIEDQPFPKQVNYHKGANHFPPVPVAEMCGRIEAACAARQDDDFVIVARTDARAAAGGSLDEVIDRLGAYREAGADVLMPQAYGGYEAAKVHEALGDAPLFWFGGVGRFGGDEVHLDELKRLNYLMVAYSITGICLAIDAVVQLYGGLRDNGVVDTEGLDDRYERIMQLIDAHAFYEIEARTTERAANAG
jgi:2,3-dimethylmalate lyase